MRQTRFYDDFKALCPFYVKESTYEIRCQGIIGELTTNAFKRTADKKTFKSACCCVDYQSCPLYKLLETESKDADI